MKTTGKMALAGVGLWALAAPDVTLAQDVNQAGATDDSVIIVSARRREESIQEVPGVVQAVSGGELEKLELRQFEDVAALVPGLNLEATLGGISGKATLRGVDFDARAAGANTTVEFYRNDAVIPSAGVFQALFDLDQIEVLRGPQGTLKGRASPSGSITIRTRKPNLEEAGGYLSGTLAERGRWNMNGAINVPVLADKLAFRLAGFVGETRGNQVRGLNLVTGTIDDDIFDKTEVIRASAQADPFDGLLIVDFNYENVSREGRFYNQVESFDQVISTAGASPVTIRSKDYLGVGGLANFSDQSLRIYNWQAQLNLLGQSLIYLGQDYKAETLSVSSQDPAGVVTNPVFNGVPFAQDTLSGSESQVHEIRLQNQDRLFGMFDYVIGYLNVEASSPTTLPTFVSSAIAPSPTAGAPFVDLALLFSLPIERFREAKEESFFGNITAHIGDRTEISGGIRRIKLRQHSGLLVAGNLLPAATDCKGFPDVDGCEPSTKATIYSASIKHDFADNIMAYASFGTAYRPGNVVVATAFTGIGPFLGQFIRPPDEKSKSYEVGVKTSWLNNTLLFNLTGYYQEFSNFAFRPGTPVLALRDVVTSAADASVTTFDGLVVPADAEIKGLEAELSWVPSDNFSLSAVLSYTEGNISDALFPCVDLNDDNIPDTTTPTAGELFAEVGANQVDTCTGSTNPGAAPKWAASAVAEYSHELTFGLEGFVRGLVSFKGNNEGLGLNPLDSVDAFTLFDLFLGVRDPEGAWNVTLYGKNLFDTHRVLTRTDAPLTTAFRLSAPQSGTNYLGITMTQPQEFGVSARIAFGSR
jgi:iron complex outermembrane recepter protein